MAFELLGWPEDGPTLRLDYRQFSYAGKFVMSGTGKAVVREGDTVVAAAAFDADRTDDTTLRVRYITVREDRQGEGLGARLLVFVRERAVERGYDRVGIAVNNPYAYEAASKAGFASTGEQTGLAEVVLAWPGDREASYTDGLALFADGEKQWASFVERRLAEGTPPPVVDYSRSGADSNSRD